MAGKPTSGDRLAEAYYVIGTVRNPSEFAAFMGTTFVYPAECHTMECINAPDTLHCHGMVNDPNGRYTCGALYVRIESTFGGAPVYESSGTGFLWRRPNVDPSSDHQRLPARSSSVWSIGPGTYGDRSVGCCEEGYVYFDSGDCETPGGCVGSWREVDDTSWTMEINPTIVVRSVAGTCCSLAGTCCDCGEGVCNCDCGDVCGRAGWCDANDPGWDDGCDRTC